MILVLIPIISNNKRTSNINNENVIIRGRAISKNRIYNCKRGATTIHPRH